MGSYHFSSVVFQNQTIVVGFSKSKLGMFFSLSKSCQIRDIARLSTYRGPQIGNGIGIYNFLFHLFTVKLIIPVGARSLKISIVDSVY